MGVFDKFKMNKEEEETQPFRNPETGMIQPTRAWPPPPEVPKAAIEPVAQVAAVRTYSGSLEVHKLPAEQITNPLRAISNVQQDGQMYVNIDEVIAYVDSVINKQGTDQAGTAYRKLLGFVTRDLNTYKEKMANI